MKLKLLTAAAAAALMAVPSLASADDSGWYIRGQAGYGLHTDTDLSGDLVGDAESTGNVTGSIGVGYDFGNNWRIELDGAHLWTDMGSIGNVPNSYSKLGTKTAMINAIYDFNDFGRWEPYIGAGVGIVRGHASSFAADFPSATPIAPGVVNVNSPACPGAAVCDFRDDDTAWGWQLLAGLGYNITEKLTWDTQYRYMNSGQLDYKGTIQPTLGTTANGAYEIDNAGSHSILTGFRYRFGAKAKPMHTCWDGSMVEDAASCPARPSYQCWNGDMVMNAGECPARPMKTCWDGSEVFESETCPVRPTFECRDGSIVFDTVANCPTVGTTVTELCANQFRQEIIYYEFDKGQSPETRNAISRILDVGAYCNVDNVRVVGHTDRSGSAAYNLNLSKRRAKDAREELVRQGINPAIITSEGKGETENFVPTADGVKEQLNRRTEVLIQLSETGVIN